MIYVPDIIGVTLFPPCRFSGGDTLDEPVTTTIVSAILLVPQAALQTIWKGPRLAFDILQACSGSISSPFERSRSSKVILSKSFLCTRLSLH